MQQYLDKTFSSVPPSAFAGEDGEGEVRITCTATFRAPCGWENHWGDFDADVDLASCPWLNVEALSHTSALLVAADLLCDEHYAALEKLGAHLSEHSYIAPPTLLLPLHPPSSASRGGPEVVSLSQDSTERLCERMRLLLADSCVDDVLSCPLPHGYALALAVAAKLQGLVTRLHDFEDELARRTAIVFKREDIMSAVHHARWEYMRRRMFQAIPPMRGRVVEEGRRVGEFELGAAVMRSHFGVVYTASVRPEAAEADEAPRSVYIIENARVTSLENMKMISSALRALEELRHVRHPTLPRLMDAFRTPRRLVVQMEHLGDYTLFSKMKQRDCPAPSVERLPMGAAALTSLVAQIFAAVGHLHNAARIAHRDLKPENIVIREVVAEPDDGVGTGIYPLLAVKVAGFELATWDGSSQVPCGTMPFAAPEVILADTAAYECMPADIWSLGVLMMELVCGLGSVNAYVPEYGRVIGDEDQVSNRCLQPPSHRVAHTIREVFSGDDFLQRFFACAVPEAEGLLAWLSPLVAGMVLVSPSRRITADEFRRFALPTI